MTNDFLKDQTCLVTGGAQGIGWATARELAAVGGTVYVCDLSEEHLRAECVRAAELPWPERFHFSRCDVSDRFEHAPGFLRWLIRQGGSARSDFGRVLPGREGGRPPTPHVGSGT